MPPSSSGRTGPRSPPGRRGPPPAGGAGPCTPRCSRVAEPRHLLVPAHHQPDRRADALGVDAQVGRAGAVDLDPQLRLVELQRRVGLHDAERLLASHHAARVRRKRDQVRPAEDEVDVPGPAADVEPADVPGGSPQVGVFPHPGPGLRHDPFWERFPWNAFHGFRRRVSFSSRVIEKYALSCGSSCTYIRPSLTPPTHPPPEVDRTSCTPRTARTLPDEGVHDLVHAGQARPLRGDHAYLEFPLVRVGGR